MKDVKKRKIAGVLYGVAVGDAIGSSYEGMGPETRQGLHMSGGGMFDLKPGSVTDDTLMTLALIESRIEDGYFNRDRFLSKMIRTVRADPRTFGRTTRTLVSLLEQGCYPENATRAIDRIFGSRSNGSVMRTAAVGIFEPESTVAQEAVRVSAFTHYDPVAGECCAAVSGMIAELIGGKERAEAYENIKSETLRPEIFTGKKIPSVDAVESTRCALSCFLSGDSVEDVAERAVSLGGDTDTIASIACGLAGAYWGVGAVPEEWIQDLLIKKQIEKLLPQIYARIT